MSNNSVICDDTTKLPEEFWEGYKGNGEPYGLINLDASRRMGRVDEIQYPDPEVMGFNPCAEQSLANFETCCLAEIYLPNIDSYDELKEVARTLYRINKHSLAIKCAIKETEDIVHKNMRMGIGVTGYLQATDEQRSWLSDCYVYLRAYDEEYSKQKGFNPSIKLTTVKPSGTLSLLAGVTSGAHPAYSQFYIRRIRMSSDSPIVNVCRKNGYPVEFQRNFDGTEDHSTAIVSFPCKFPKHTILADDMTAVDQLNVIKRLQTEWSDNAVSVTIYYRKHELDEIKQWLSENYFNVKSVSFLLHNDHGFDQAPLEEITEDRYNELSASVIPISSFDDTINLDDLDIADCDGGACPVR
jgi:ribonucleotide reductase alpha subunit